MQIALQRLRLWPQHIAPVNLHIAECSKPHSLSFRASKTSASDHEGSFFC